RGDCHDEAVARPPPAPSPAAEDGAAAASSRGPGQDRGQSGFGGPERSDKGIGLSTPALKEWSAAVRAMLDGRQTVLLRKGGIHEKRFALNAPEFVFFPTVAHGHRERLRPEYQPLLDDAAADSTQEAVVIRGGAKVVAAVEVNRPEALERIAEFHIWTAESVRADRLDFRPRHRLTALVVQAVPL